MKTKYREKLIAYKKACEHIIKKDTKVSNKLFVLSLSVFILFGQTVIGSDFEARVYGVNILDKSLNKDGPYMILECHNSKFSFQINWRKRVGNFREKCRHLFYHVDGNKHLLLPVVNKNGESTGYIYESEKAKSLVHEIFTTVQKDIIPIGVFPSGQDPVTGEWIDAWFSTVGFKKAALFVGKSCEYDPRQSQQNFHNIDKVPPAPEGQY